jgi:general secretion pathway protein G
MRTRRETAGSLGFTLIEILIAMAIIGVLASLVIPKYADYREGVRVYQAETEIGAMSVIISNYMLDTGSPPDTLAQVGAAGKLDPWGWPYEYFNLTSRKGNGHARKDKSLNPLNSDFDLYSVGKDGSSQSSLMAKTSRDDVIRARDGRFIGLATDFDP